MLRTSSIALVAIALSACGGDAKAPTPAAPIAPQAAAPAPAAKPTLTYFTMKG